MSLMYELFDVVSTLIICYLLLKVNKAKEQQGKAIESMAIRIKPLEEIVEGMTLSRVCQTKNGLFVSREFMRELDELLGKYGLDKNKIK